MYRLTAQRYSITDALSEVGLHDHLCLVYETREEQLAAVVPFIRMGLERGERCVYIADENTALEISEVLKADGIDVDGAIASGALIIAGKRDTYLREGFFDPDSMIGFLKETVEDAKAAGFRALRATGEMSWALGGDPGSERLIEYEAKLNYFFPENDILGICQYDRNRFSPDIIMDVIHTHPLVIYGGLVCKNDNYVSPDDFLAKGRPSMEVEHLLETMLEREKLVKELKASKKELERNINYLKQEVAERKQAEGALEEKTRLSQAFLDAIPGVALLLNSDREVLLSSKAGREAGALPCEQCFSTWGKREEPCPWCLAPKALETGKPQHVVVEALGVVWDAHWIPLGPDLYMHYAFDITERKGTEEELRNINELLASVREAQALFIAEGDPKPVFEKLLDAFVRLTDSKYGFIDEVLLDQSGQLLKKSLALSDISWDEASRKLYQRLVENHMEFRNLETLAGAPVVSGKVVISNDPSRDPRSCGLPEGHPPIDNFMGIPLYFSEELVGVAGVANRPGGYSEEIADFLGPFVATCASLIHSLRSEKRREKAEKSLKQSEERYRSLFEDSRDAIYVTNPDGDFIDANDAALELFGYSREELSGLNAVDLYLDPKDRPRFQRVMEREGYVRDYEIKFKKKDGSEIDCLVTALLRRAADESILWYQGIIRDVTGSRRAEERIRKLYRAVEQSPTSVVITDTKGAIEYVNPKFVELTGYTPEEVLGQNPRILKSDEHPPEFYRDLWKTITSGREWRGEFCNKKKSGELYWEYAVVSPIRNEDGEVTHFVAVKEDITERKRAKEAVEETRAFYEQLVGEAGDAIVVLDREGTVLSWNKGSELIFGWSSEEILGRSYFDFHPAERAREIEENVRRVFADETITTEIHRQRKDGTAFYGLLTAAPVRDTDGDIVAAQAIIKDITELKRAHEELQKAYDDLAQAQATALTSEKLAAVGRLTAGVSHEILNPLNAITISLHLMINDDETSPSLVEDLQEVMDQARRITKISQDLLYFSRQRPPERTAVDINEVLERTVGLLEHELRLSDIEVMKELADGFPEIWADQDQIQQVVLNLISNARDAMPDGGHLILKTAESPPLFKSESMSLELRVEDSGGGIDPEHLDKLFEPFFTTKPEGKGTGMGLSICHGIIEAHGGIIWAENVPSGGAAFVLRLPLGQGQEAGSASGGEPGKT